MLDVTRMIELEEMAKNKDIKYPLTIDEWRYIERAEKIPYELAKEGIFSLGGCGLPLEQIKCIYSLLAKFKCSDEELKQRFNDVHCILEYLNLKYTNLVKEQKRMVKRINNFSN